MKTTQQIIDGFKLIHSDKYDYSKVNYINNRTKVCIICPIHGEFYQTPNAHSNGQGCSQCGIIQRAKKQCTTNEQFIQKANLIYGNKYDYPKLDYQGNKIKVCITCPIHGDFFKTPDHHLRGQGCPKCSRSKLSKLLSFTNEQFIEKAKEIHNDKYTYSKTEYNGYDELVTIICPEHGEFKQTPDAHLQGSGCQKCAYKISKAEVEITSYIQSLIGEESVETRNRKILNKQEIDIFIPSQNIGIEYNGVKWHSEQYNKDKNYHLNKTLQCQVKGIKLYHIFEDEYMLHKDIVLNKLSHILKIQKTLPKIPGRKCMIKEINYKSASEFLEKYHIQGKSHGTVYLGAFYNNELVGVMVFLQESLKNWNLVRFVTNYDYICQGIGGKLFKYFIVQNNPYIIKSFADRRWTLDENDNVYIKLGFEFNKYILPDYRYYKGSVNKYKRFHKFNFRKKILHEKYGLPLIMTEDEMVSHLGFYKIWDCGLIKYVWHKNNLK